MFIKRGQNQDQQVVHSEVGDCTDHLGGEKKIRERERNRQTDNTVKERERERESAHLTAHIRVLIAQRHIIKNHESIMYSVYQCNQIFQVPVK